MHSIDMKVRQLAALHRTAPLSGRKTTVQLSDIVLRDKSPQLLPESGSGLVRVLRHIAALNVEHTLVL